MNDDVEETLCYAACCSKHVILLRVIPLKYHTSSEESCYRSHPPDESPELQKPMTCAKSHNPQK